MPSAAQLRLLKVTVFLTCLAPLAKLGLEAFGLIEPGLGANPIEELLHRCGKWGLNFLLITLTVTPLRRFTGMSWLLRFRRMLGLFAFFYLLLHLTIYLVLDQGLAFAYITEDIAERPYITLGMTGLLLLIPLAITSTNRMMRRLGRRWQKLHRLIYVVGILGVIHFLWQAKEDFLEPQIYATMLGALLLYRLWFRYGRRQADRWQFRGQYKKGGQ